MATTGSPACEGCGAPLWLPEGASTATCSFCGRAHVVRAGRPAGAPSPAGRPAGPTSSWPRFVVAFLVFDLVVGVVIAVAVLVAPGRAAGPTVFERPSAGPATGPGSGGVVPEGEHLQWNASGQSVAPADVDGDGVEDVVGLYRLLELPSGAQTVYAGAFRGTTFERIWKSPPLGSFLTAPGAHVAVAGRRALVTGGTVGHVLDIATGRELSAVKLTDQAQGICAPRGGGRQLFVQVLDGANVLVDVETGAATRALVPPPGCGGRADRECRSIHGVCAPVDHTPLDGLMPRAALVEGRAGVLVGFKTPGTPVPVVAGFDPATRAVRWSSPVIPDATSPAMDAPADLLGGVLVTGASPAPLSPFQLVALDAATGARRWAVVVPRSGEGSGPEQLVLTATRVYVPHWTWLDVHDARDGHHLGTIGIW
jgi:LSD1 subclass zinc finger protein